MSVLIRISKGEIDSHIIVLIDKKSEALGNGDFVIEIFLDSSKALDTVDHIVSSQKTYSKV